ncbi:hypothetical protein ACTFIR_012811 [Dictyostelium discoideum]
MVTQLYQQNDRPQKIEFNTPTELTNVDASNCTVNIFNHPKRLNSNKELINDEEYELIYSIKFDEETNKPIISLLQSTGINYTALIQTLKCLIVPNKDNMNKPKIIFNSHSKEEQFKLILDTGSNNWISLIKHFTVSNDNKSVSFNLLDDEKDIKEQVTKSDLKLKKVISYFKKITKRSESKLLISNHVIKEDRFTTSSHDYRQVNKVTVRDDHPFTPVDSLLN